MLYIQQKGINFEWHVNEELPDWCNISSIVSVQADGDELELIRDNYPSFVAQTHIPVQSFYGDIAKMIVANLCKK